MKKEANKKEELSEKSEVEKQDEQLSPAIGAQSDSIFEMLKPMSFDEYKATLSFGGRLFAQKKYDNYRRKIAEKNTILEENKKLYESIKAEMSEKIRKVGSPEDWFVHDAMLLDNLKKNMQEVREKQQNFIATFFNKQFMKAVRTLYTIIVALGPDHPLNKLFHKYLGGILEQDEDNIDKIDLVENLLAMEEHLHDSEEIADSLYWKLFEETSNAYKELETEQEALEKNAQKFKNEVEQLQKQLVESQELFENLVPPEEVYEKLEAEILAEINDTTEEQSTTNFMINVLREANQKYSKKYNGLEKRIEQLQDDLENAKEEYGEFLVDEYELYIENHTERIQQLDGSKFKQIDSIEELDAIYKGMRKHLYSNRVYDKLIVEYNDLFDTQLKVSALEGYEKLQEQKDLELQSACHECLQDNMWKEREEKLSKVDDTIVELQRKKVHEVLQTKIQEYTVKVNDLQEKNKKYELLVSRLIELFAQIPEGVKGNMQRNIPGYFDEEVQFFEIINNWNKSVDNLLKEKTVLEETIVHYKGILHQEQREELQKNLNVDDTFEYINWQELYDSFEGAEIGKDHPLRKYFILQNSTDYVLTDENIIVFTRDGNIAIFSQDDDVVDILRDKQGDYTQVSDAKMQLLLDKNGEQDDATFNKLVALADNSEYTKKIRKMIDHIGDRRLQNLHPDKPDNISSLSIPLQTGGGKSLKTEHERKQFLEETYEDIYKKNLIDGGYLLLAAQYEQKEFPMINGLLLVEIDGKQGLVEKSGEWISEGCILDKVINFGDEIALINKGNKWGYMSKQGELVRKTINLPQNFISRLVSDYSRNSIGAKRAVQQALDITVKQSKEKGNTVEIAGKIFSFLRPDVNNKDVFAGKEGSGYEHVRYIRGDAMENYLGENDQMFAGKDDFEQFIEDNIPGKSRITKLQNYAGLMGLELSGYRSPVAGFEDLNSLGYAWVSRSVGGGAYELKVQSSDAYANWGARKFAQPVVVFSS